MKKTSNDKPTSKCKTRKRKPIANKSRKALSATKNLYHLTDLDKVRRGLNHVLNELHQDHISIGKARAMTFVMKAIAEIYVAQREFEIEERLIKLEDAAAGHRPFWKVGLGGQANVEQAR
jgi:hypothetical protein